MSLPVPISGVEVLDPLDRGTIEEVIAQSNQAMSGLTKWEQRQLEWQVRRGQRGLVIQLAQLRNKTILAEAIIGAEAQLAATRERAAVSLLEQTCESLLKAGALRDRAMAEAMRLSPGSGEMMADAIDGLMGSYIGGVHKRARR